VEGDLNFLATLSCRTEALTVGGASIAEWAHTLVDGVIANAKRFASHTYDRRLEEVDPFPIFVFEKGVVENAGAVHPSKSKGAHRDWSAANPTTTNSLNSFWNRKN
jgi:hypothetical protein